MTSGPPVGDEEWAALRDAVPGFAAPWDAYRASSGYVREEAFVRVSELVRHVAERLDAGDEAPLLAVFDAFEAVYAPADDALEAVLRVGVLEELMHAAEQARLDLARLWLRLGPAGRLAWDAAYRYTHPGRRWEPPPAVPRPRPRRAGGKTGRKK